MNGRKARINHRRQELNLVAGGLSAVLALLNRGFWGRLRWLLLGK